MRTDIIAFVTASENRKKIVKALLDSPKRLWSSSLVEDVTKLPHATVFRTMQGLLEFGLVTSFKVNKKDVVFELVESPISEELKNVLNLYQRNARAIAQEFAQRIKKWAVSIVLYGSSVKGTATHLSDIDVLVVVQDKKQERSIQDIAAELSSRYNKAISAVVIDIKESKKKDSFFNSVKEHMEVLHGKEPF